MNDSRADEILRQHEGMKGLRGNWETMWQEIADRIFVRQAEFVSKRSAGEKRTERMFDSTAALGLERFGAAMNSVNTPSTQMWHELRMLNPEYAEDIQVQQYLDAVTKTLFRARYRPAANFVGQIIETYLSLGAFGTGVLFVDEFPGVGLYYKAIHLAECYIAESAQGMIDTVHREYEYTAHQIVERFGMVAGLPDKVKTCYEKGDRNTKFTLIHCVKPNMDRQSGRMDYRGRKFISYDILCEGKVMLRESGYNTMPYCVARYSTSPREVYGRGPASLVLPDIKVLNEMEKTTLRAGHKAVSPPLLLSDDGALTSFNATPDALNYGALDEQGNPRVRPLDTGANLPWAFEMADAKRRVIQDAFLVTLFQILVESPNMTATEALLRAQEKGELLAPTGGKLQNELFGPMIERELDILGRAGQFPEEVPAAIQEAGGEIEVEYTSPLARMQRSEDGIAILRSIEQLAPLAQIDPRALRRINADKALKELWDINGAPASILYTDDELAAMDEQEQAQAQTEQLLAAAPVAANAAKTLAQANQVAQQTPTGIPEQIGL